MAVDGCGVVCKYILVLFNIIFSVVGLAFLALGLWLRFSDGTRGIFNVEALNSSAFVLGVTVLIVLGSVMLVVVVFGDYGACSEKRCALQTFIVLLFFLAVAEVVVGVLAYTSRDEVGRRLGEFYVSLYTLYANNNDPALAITLTFIHNTLHCCGVTGISLVEIVKKTCPKPDGFMESLVMANCPTTILNVFDRRASLVLGVFLGTGALLFVALICSVTLNAKIRQSASPPQYIILTQSTAALTVSQPPQQDFGSPPHPYQDPVVFTPLSAANIPIQA
ncbi:CD81 antigen isoform X1 [Oryzias latipes]|uniref:Tetraspanin n=1 Tax=Oryzias latipes TaxID=8090 RepID=H2MJB6_ORYLA|nr:CD81 antigen isoform X1 [Oryzias latipes]XP_011476839.1 CD81 antigen isoform X1 [Oryzias latipes]